MAALPLAGYRVLELAHLIAGPACGMYLADMGADVVKLEQPTGGDASRTAYGSQFGGESAVFVTVNRNKRSLALDLARSEGRAAFERLVARADVVIEAYRGGVAERLGIDWERLAPLNPRLVYCSLSAFGPTGPWRHKPGVDMLVQAMGGLMAVRMPWPAISAPIVSSTGAPHSTGGPSGSPITAMSPPIACTSMSTPGLSRHGPVGPKADSEQ